MLKVRLERDEEPTDQPRDKRTNAVGIEQHEREKNAILWAEEGRKGCTSSQKKDFQVIRRSRAQAWKCVWSEGR